MTRTTRTTRTTRPARPRLRALLLRAGALGLSGALLAGCGGQAPPAAGPPVAEERAPVGAEAASSPAAELHAGLTAVLVERSYALAAATEAVVAAGGQQSEPRAAAAVGALEQASSALADVLGATYSTAREPLHEALRRVDRALAEHATALADGPTSGTEPARERLAAEHFELGQVVRRVVPKLDADELAGRLSAEVGTQLGYDDPRRLRAAATEAAATAHLLAAGIARDRQLGDVGTTAVRLRAELTQLLTEHVALVGVLARSVQGPPPRRERAREALQGNADALGELLGSHYPAARAAFTRSWSAHLSRLDRYAGDPAAEDRRLVLPYAQELARLLGEHVDGLPAASSQAELEPALEAALEAVDAAGTAQGPAALRTATAAVLPMSALLSAGIAQDLRLA